MPSFTARLADGWERALSNLPLALVPLVAALLQTDKIRQVLAFRGGHVGFRIGLPVSIVDLWQFVSVPNSGVNVDVGGSLGSPLAVVGLAATVLVQAALAAGYFGSIRDLLVSETYDFAGNVRRFIRPFLLYTLVPVLLLLPLALLFAGGGERAFVPAVVLLVPAIIVASYLFYATPYLVVLRETDLVSAARASYGFAIGGGPYLRYAVGFALFVLVGSGVMTAFVVNLGAVGILLGVVVASPVGLAANVATMRFVGDVDPDSPSLGSSDGGMAHSTAGSDGPE